MGEYIGMSRKMNGGMDKDLRGLMREFASLPESGCLGGTQEQEWTLADLENVVYEFVNFNARRVNQDFLETKYKNQDVSKEDLMKI
jgi:hypothetical protein